MKCEGFSQISDLHYYLSNNLIIAHYCGFDISRDLPSYAKFTGFIREFDNDMLQTVMQSQVLKAAGLSLIDSSFITLDATPVKANVSNNNPKSFKKDKFSKASPPKADKDCRLGVQTASNQHNEKRANSFLPLAECTFLADKAHDVKAIYNAVHDIYNGDCFIALNK